MTFTIHSDTFPQTVVNGWIAKFLPTDVQIIEINSTRDTDEIEATIREVEQQLDTMIFRTRELSKKVDEDFEELITQLKGDFQELRENIK